MSLRKCFEDRLLREVKPDPEKTRRSLEVSRSKLEAAESTLKHELYDLTVILGYTAMFHAGRAILYRDGVEEKSHYCLVVYLREAYRGRIPLRLINSLDNYRIERHEALYGLEFKATRGDAEQVVRDAADLINVSEAILATSSRGPLAGG